MIEGEEQPKRSILESTDTRSILDEVLCDISNLVDLEFDCSLLVSGLVAQGKFLGSGMTDNAEMEELSSEILRKISTDLLQSTERLKSAVDLLIALRGELDGAGILIEAEPTPFSLMPTQDRGWRAVWEKVYEEGGRRQI